jgi:truncated hemoglobin YjbI
MSSSRRLRRAAAFAWVGLFLAGAAAAQDVEKASIDKQLSDALRDMHNRAADVFNVAKDYNGAYRMFQGGLYLARPLLNHRPDVQLILDSGLQEAERMPSLPDRAMRLHKTIEDMRAKLKPGAPPAPPAGEPKPAPANPPPSTPSTSPPPVNPMPTTPPPITPPLSEPFPPAPSAPITLWKRLGGEPRVKEVVDNLVTLVINDPKVEFTRGGKFNFTTKEQEDALKAKLVAFISSVSDGSIAYTGRNMADAHRGMQITTEQFDTFAASLRVALNNKKVDAGAADDLMKKVEATRADIVGK